MDIVGFSKLIDNNLELANARQTLFQAVTKTALFQSTNKKDAVRAHFLGDELRLAFLANEVDAEHGAVNFVLNVLQNLKGRTPALDIRSVVLTGSVVARERLDCKYLEGYVTIRAQRWLGAKELKPGGIATDSKPGGEWSLVKIGEEDAWMRNIDRNGLKEALK
jgi:hypothetical protein